MQQLSAKKHAEQQQPPKRPTQPTPKHHHQPRKVRMSEEQAIKLKEGLMTSGKWDEMVAGVGSRAPIKVSSTDHFPGSPAYQPPRAQKKGKNMDSSGAAASRQRRGAKTTKIKDKTTEIKDKAKDRTEGTFDSDYDFSFTLWFDAYDLTTHTGFAFTVSLPTAVFGDLNEITFGISTNDFFCQGDVWDGTLGGHESDTFVKGLFQTPFSAWRFHLLQI